MARKSQTKYYFSVVGVIVLIILAVVAVLNAGQLQNALSPIEPNSKPSAGLNEPVTSYVFRDTFEDGNIDSDSWSQERREAVAGEVKIVEKRGEKLKIRVPAGLVAGQNKFGALQFNGIATVSASPIADFVFKVELRRVEVPKGSLGRGGIRFMTGPAGESEAAVIKRVSQPGKDELQFIVRKPGGTLAESEIVKIKADKVTLKLERVGNKYRAWYKPGVDDGKVAWSKIGVEQEDLSGGSGFLELFAANSKEDGGKSVDTRFDDVVVKW